MKENFKLLMMKKKNYVGSMDEVDMLFEWGGREDPDKVHNDVLPKLKEIKDRNVTTKLISQLQRMDMLGSKEKKDGDDKNLNKALTKLFGKETSSKKTIKEKLSKGLYTSDKSTGKESQSTMFQS